MTIYLYVKRHNATGLRYLGKTTAKDPYRYKGSGVEWQKHLELYGENFTTEILLATESKTELRETGIFFSRLWDIVKSDEWANKIPETGDGISREAAQLEQKRRYDNGTHNFIGLNQKRIAEGTHHWLGGEIQRKQSARQFENGNHPFIGMNEKRIKEGTHQFKNSEWQRSIALKAIAEGKHNLVGGVTCRDCKGVVVQIPKEEYHAQPGPKNQWKFVSINSAEGRKRKPSAA